MKFAKIHAKIILQELCRFLWKENVICISENHRDKIPIPLRKRIFACNLLLVTSLLMVRWIFIFYFSTTPTTMSHFKNTS